MTPRAFDGAVAIVTGGASGIGRGLVEELRRRGATVVAADRQECDERLDVRDAAAVKGLVESVAERHGRLDWLFNNAGIAVGAPALEHSLDDWNQTLDVNVRGVVHGCHAALPVMKAQGFGHIVNTASVAGLAPLPGAAAYTASKHAVVGLSAALRIEAAAFGVRVSALCPGFVRTPILSGGAFGRNVMDAGDVVRRAERHGMIEVDELVRRALPRLARNDAVVIEPPRYRLFAWLARSFPAALEGRVRREYEDGLARREKAG